MALRSGRRGQPAIEVRPANEQAAGVPAPERDTRAVVRRDPRGRVADRTSAAELGALGGKALADRTRLSHRLALGESFADPRFEPYARAARAYRRAQVARLARLAGGGECGPGPASCIASAALELAASRFAFEVLGDLSLGSRLAAAARQNLLAAHELCVLEATATRTAPRAPTAITPSMLAKLQAEGWIEAPAPTPTTSPSTPPPEDHDR